MSEQPIDHRTMSPQNTLTCTTSLVATTTTPSQPTSCAFFDKLPAELRLDVYELTFAQHDDKEVELITSSPPSASLLLACRKTYHEARATYQQARRRYWKETKFSIQVTDPRLPLALHAALPRLKRQGLEHIRHLRIRFCHPTFAGIYDQYELVTVRGVWRRVVVRPGLWSSTCACIDRFRSLKIWDTEEEAHESLVRHGERLGIKAQILYVIERC
ncbi:hypothetical protein CLAFUW4_12233 [Fulvia fulva]|uniref:Uncharacterized protein n=1 Tax=Passalora fulva TaxID=5499 RepID=A0A9Q8PEC8_PASFU|nr:uncharacterized protein CLAFUR5_11263 [Fulvia fulva]KAK4618193.1 hypothetical protein CLAFUR4_12238 [Fulvia fulva]KAK4618717.1 hypothetical protein CLAFUR0_12249 [Fulvia fulva]UJO20885.1 hypothetical protein CLAFUR5_11263 [Fulvia fulva]WPV18620.1 hypothetical protein CLAFUW4_12233 [Fulvia fulva]WPV33548.1 hypothetical protein CLAFUW7_12240 [Fulvia fulva]